MKSPALTLAALTLAAAGLLIAHPASSAGIDGLGVRAGVGTDINLGLGYGANINYLLPIGPNPLEVGLSVYGAHTTEETDEGNHTYDETTDVLVVAVMANYLLNYAPEANTLYFIGGVGLGFASVEWEEESDTDTSLGTPRAGGGSKQSEEGTTGGVLFDLGIGYHITDQIDVRAEVPVLFIADAPGDSSAVVPFFTVTAGFRF